MVWPAQVSKHTVTVTCRQPNIKLVLQRNLEILSSFFLGVGFFCFAAGTKGKFSVEVGDKERKGKKIKQPRERERKRLGAGGVN